MRNTLRRFLKVKNLSPLNIQHPFFEQVLLDWAEHQNFTINTPELYQLCVHPLQSVRTLGLEKAQQLGLTNEFALQLFESKTPDAEQIAQSFFEKRLLQPHQITETILVLCDSPSEATRAYGLQILKAQEDLLQNHPAILEALSEHSDATIQNFVAEKLIPVEKHPTFVKNFDKSVLKMQNRSRPAKEDIKKRIEQNLEIDVQTLLTLAGSNTRQEAEWAVVQLTKLALQGHQIEGFALD